MSELAAHLVDRVIPKVPVRQWVLGLPFTLRYQLAFDPPLTAAVLDVFIRTVFPGLRRAAVREGIADAQGVARRSPGSREPAHLDAVSVALVIKRSADLRRLLARSQPALDDGPDLHHAERDERQGMFPF